MDLNDAWDMDYDKVLICEDAQSYIWNSDNIMFPLKHTIHHLIRISAFALSFTTCGVIYATPLDIADFFPLDVSSQWTYAGTVTETTPELPIGLTLGGTVIRQNLPGGTFHGRETTLVLDLAAATTSVGGELFEASNGIYYSLNEEEFAAHRSDRVSPADSDISLFDALFLLPHDSLILGTAFLRM